MGVKMRVKIALCVFLVLFAAASLLAVLADLGLFSPPEAAPASAQNGYALRLRDGYVALFSPPDADEPQTVTDIRGADLPPVDRLALTAGVTAADRDEAMRLLEDYGA